MSRRAEDLANFRSQMTPDGPPTPPRLFWFVMGVSVGLAAETIWEPGTEWWKVTFFAITVGGVIGLILNIPVWFVWTALIHPIGSNIISRYQERRERKEAEWWATHYDDEGNWIGPEKDNPYRRQEE